MTIGGRRCLLPPIFALIVWSHAQTSGFQSTLQQTFRSRTDVVLVSASVAGPRGPIKDLGVDDFELRDNGVRQTLSSVQAETLPIDLSLVVDASESVVSSLSTLKDELKDLVSVLTDQDRVRLVTFGTEIDLVQPWQSARLPVLVDTNTPNSSGTALYDGVFYALTQPPASGRRHVIAVFTDGLDTWSWVNPSQLADLASRSESILNIVTVNPSPVTLVGNPSIRWSPVGLPDEIKRILANAATTTGGTLYSSQAGAQYRLSRDLKRLVRDFRQNYLLTYAPQGISASGWHDISVKVLHYDKVTVRARKGYSR